MPLNAVNAGALGLSVPGVLTVGTLSDAPPSICINSAGQFTGFDNEVLRAIAGKLGLQINFVGTDLGRDGMTMVVVTHEMGFARSTSDAVVFMDHGQVVESGTPEQIFDAAETDRLRRFLSQVL